MVIFIGLTFSFLEIIGGIIGIIAISIVFWDHYKDDRRLTTRVQAFYEDIENLLYSNYKYHILDKLGQVQEINMISKEELMKLYYQYRRENYMYRGFIEQKFNEYSKYLGMTYRPESGHKFIINTTDLFILKEGRLMRDISSDKGFQLDNITEDYLNITSSEISEITCFLDSLKEYWKKNYGRKLFRPNLKSYVDFNLIRNTESLYHNHI